MEDRERERKGRDRESESERARAREREREREREAVVVCRELAIPPFRPLSSLEEGVGEGTGWRNYAKNVQLVNRA